MLDEYEEIVGSHSPVAVIDKPAEVNGTLGSMEATGTGAFFVTKEIVEDLGLTKKASIAVQGFGDVGRTITRLLHNEGFKVIAVSDIKGGIYSKEGLDVEKLVENIEDTGFVAGFPGAVAITNKELLETILTAKEKYTSFRSAAWINALTKISKTMKVRGWI